MRARILAASAFLALLLAAAPARGQQRVYAITPQIVFLPQDGVALEAATGHVAWRMNRFDGRVLTDGRGLLIYSYLAGINDLLHFHEYRICRVHSANGRRIWCTIVAHLDDLALSSAGDLLFLRQQHMLEIRAAASGSRLASFNLGGFDDPEVLALPDDGVAVFSSSMRRSRLLTIFYRDQAAQARMRIFDRPLHAFHGPGPGVLWYAPAAGQFVSIADGGQPAAYGGAAAASFPRAVTGGAGFLIERQERDAWDLAGGLYAGQSWNHPLGERAAMYLAGGAALLLSARTEKAGGKGGMGPAAPAVGTQVRSIALADGRERFRVSLPVQLDIALLDADSAPSPEAALLGPQAIVLLDGRTGAIRWWRDYARDQPAALTAPAVLVWDNGELVALARANGDVLWRVHFRLVGHS